MPEELLHLLDCTKRLSKTLKTIPNYSTSFSYFFKSNFLFIDRWVLSYVGENGRYADQTTTGRNHDWQLGNKPRTITPRSFSMKIKHKNVLKVIKFI